MALKPTIFKVKINLSDFDQNRFDTLQLTIAQHPSETMERMAARILAFCLNSAEGLTFTKGLCDAEQADIWLKNYHDDIECWIDVGEPAAERIKKATRLAKQVKLYSFNSKSATWWQQEQTKFADLSVDVFQFDWQHIQQFAALIDRTVELSITITDGSLFVTAPHGDCEIHCNVLQA